MTEPDIPTGGQQDRSAHGRTEFDRGECAAYMRKDANGRMLRRPPLFCWQIFVQFSQKRGYKFGTDSKNNFSMQNPLTQ